MSLHLKTGLGEPRIFGTRAEILVAVIVAEGIYREAGFDLTWTAGIDGKHADGSSHYNGCAVDLRTSNVPPEKQADILAEIQKRLTSDFFAQVEADHIHIQFKPIKTYTG